MRNCDGLTDGWEAITSFCINSYKPTNLSNRGLDGNGAIDSGESNVYPGTLIDIDNGCVIDLGKQMDLNKDEIIEMGEENYYEIPPGKVTYFLDIFAVFAQFAVKNSTTVNTAKYAKI